MKRFKSTKRAIKRGHLIKMFDAFLNRHYLLRVTSNGKLVPYNV